ncbi:MAG: hypothetical protein ACREQY_10425 [Candidatus Binatia bacterium]
MLAALSLFCFALPAGAELLPLAPLPDAKSFRLTLEILPADPTKKLSEEVRAVEGGRLVVEETSVGPDRYRKSVLVLPLPSGDTRERVIFFAEEDERLRMLGFHRIRRHNEMPAGETIVFNPGPTNPLKGLPNQVPTDTYTYLSLFSALGGLATGKDPLRAHIWTAGAGAVAVEIVPDGVEELSVLGTRVKSRRLRVRAAEARGAEALYWLAHEPPHSFLQYRGPGDFLTDAPGEAEPVLLRATSSSEQVNRLFGGP